MKYTKKCAALTMMTKTRSPTVEKAINRSRQRFKVLAWFRLVIPFLLVSLFAVAGLLLFQASCHSSIPVIINNEMYQCEIEQTGSDGKIGFEDCIKTDGTGPQIIEPARDKESSMWIPPGRSEARMN